MEKIAFVTGGSGYIGSYLVRQLLKKQYKVVVFDLKFTDQFKSIYGNQVSTVTGNLNSDSLRLAIDKYKPTHVFHLAGLKNRTNNQDEFISSIDVNYKGALNLFSLLNDDEHLEHLVIMGTTEEYGSALSPFTEETRELPNSAYGLSKLSATRLALLFFSQYGLPVTILRPTIAYGPNQGAEMFLPALIRSLQEGREFKMTKGDQLRDFIYIDDLVDAMCLAAETDKTKGKILNVAYGKSEKLGDVAQYVAKELGKENLLKLGVIPYRKFEIMNYSVSVEKAKTLLNWDPKVSIYDGVKKLM